MNYREKMTANLEQAMQIATDVSVKNGVTYIGSEHLIYAFLSMPSCVAYRVLTEKITFTQYFDTFVRNLDKKIRARGLTERTKEMFLRAVQLASKSGEKAGTAHFLLAVLEQENCFAVKILRSLGVDIAELKRRVTEELRSGCTSAEEGTANVSKEAAYRAENAFSAQDYDGENTFGAASSGFGTEIGGAASIAGKKGAKSVAEDKKNGAVGAGESIFSDEKLMRFGVDLTERAKKGKLDPVIGREKEIEKLVQVLCRRSKNNPVLIGEPGVGKSAIAEGLAQLIAEGNVPEQLYNKKVFSDKIKNTSP